MASGIATSNVMTYSMSDFTWYSRLLVWIGAIILLVESITGRSVAFFTVAAVIVLSIGLIAFIGGLAFDGLPARIPVTEPPVTVDHTLEPDTQEEEPASVPVSEPASAADSGSSDSAPPPEREEPISVQPARSFTTSSPRSPRGAVTLPVRVDNELVGKPCLACQEPLRVTQTAALCPECGSQHHAACWVENRFHCARQGCGGHGGLIAPAEEDEASPASANSSD